MLTPAIYSIDSKVYKHLPISPGIEEDTLVLLITAKCPYNFHCLTDSSVCGLINTEECPFWPLNPLKIKRLFKEVIRDD